MKECPLGEANLEEVTNHMLQQFNASFYASYTNPIELEKIKESLLYLRPSTQAADSLSFFISKTNGFLVEFLNDCSSSFMFFDYNSTLRFLILFGSV